MKSIYFLCFFLSFSLFSQLEVVAKEKADQTYPVSTILRIEINSSINPATLSYVSEALKEANHLSQSLVLMELNTPGGLVSTTKEILVGFGDSSVPVIVWVRPEGASATSAGAIIASGSHLLYMSEGTNIGAATPIQMSGDIDKKSDLRKKSINDLVALVKSLSLARGRNPEPFADMIEKASSFEARVALKKNLINGIANTQDELLQALEGNRFFLKGQERTLSLKTPLIKDFPMDQGQKLLNTFANPSTAYILFLVGAALVYLEFQAAGGFIAGAIGALCLILSGIGFQVLPLNYGALGLMLLAFVLFIMEVYITSYGILALAGMASLVTGSLFLYRTDDAYLSLSHELIFSVVAAIGVFIALCLFLIIRERDKVGKGQFNSQVDKLGSVVKSLGPKGDLFAYQVKIGGEMWQAEAREALDIGEQIKVISKVENHLTLRVERVG
jgi:membrane-bound serine protease (ClpP class)